jgi:hypothetical protein
MSAIYLFLFASALPIGIGAVVFLVAVAAAFIIFKMMARTVKLAFRLIILVVILVAAAAGAVSLYWFAAAEKPARPAPTRSR